MKAAIINHYSDKVDNFEIVPNLAKPLIKKNELLIHNKSASVNPIDTLKRKGYGRIIFARKRHPEFPYILGCDAAGIITKIGDNISNFKVGDEVYYVADAFKHGTYAEYTAVEISHVYRKPCNLNFVEAASIPYVAATVWSALVGKAKMNPLQSQGKKVLVHAGSGGIGSFAIQLLKTWGCFVATTCSTQNIEFCKNLGANIVIDYTAENFSEKLVDFDIVLDTLGFRVPGTEEKSIQVLKQNKSSCYVTIVHPIMQNFDQHGLFLGLLLSIYQGYIKSFTYRPVRYEWALYKPSQAAFEHITPLIEDSKIKPVIDKILKLEEVKLAHQIIESHHTRGKVVLTI